MRPWAQWTAKTALLAAGFAAAAGGLPGVALAAGGSASSDAGPGLTAPIGVPVNLCGISPAGLPTTGADLLLLGVVALGTIGVGAGAVAVARRRRNSEV